MTLTGYNLTKGHQFTVQKKGYTQTLTLNADLRYWPAFGDNDAQSSGAYIFRVATGVSESLRYS
jgi:hypothetical protein